MSITRPKQMETGLIPALLGESRGERLAVPGRRIEHFARRPGAEVPRPDRGRSEADFTIALGLRPGPTIAAVSRNPERAPLDRASGSAGLSRLGRRGRGLWALELVVAQAGEERGRTPRVGQ